MTSWILGGRRTPSVYISLWRVKLALVVSVSHERGRCYSENKILIDDFLIECEFFRCDKIRRMLGANIHEMRKRKEKMNRKFEGKKE